MNAQIVREYMKENIFEDIFGKVNSWVGLWGTVAHYCIAASPEVYSLSSNLQAQQQCFAFQQSDSSE